jgi:hypothetical protein
VLYAVLDNLHNHPRFLALLERVRIHPAFTPTDASWLNPIEPHFGVMRHRYRQPSFGRVALD